MNTKTRVRQALHLSVSDDDCALLALELSDAAAEFEVQRIESAPELQRAVAERTIDLLIADLPLPWPSAHDDLAELQRKRPEIEVIFRWGDPGLRSVEDEEEGLQRLVHRRLESAPTRTQSEDQRRAAIRELARRQEALLRIHRLPSWDLDLVLRETTRTAAELLCVERVSVWEFSRDHASLTCSMLYRRGPGQFESGQVLSSYPRYFRALDTSLSIAAHDSRLDPRTSEFTKDYLVPLGITSMLDSPVRLDGRVVGVLCIEHVGEPRHWTTIDQCAASSLACYLARAFETHRRRVAEERLHAAQHLSSLGRVAGQIAHDFNNRLTVIGGWAEVLASEVGLSPRAAEGIEQLRSEVRRAAERVRELLSLGREQRRNSAESLELASAVRAGRATLERALGAEIELELELRGEDLRVNLNAQELDSVLLNLCANARDALNGRGRVRIAVSRSLDDDGRELAALVIEDDGPGLSADALAHAFEPLFTTKAPNEGSGLGLASVRAIVDGAGGEVRASNRSPHGARIEIQLPSLVR